MSRSDIFVIEYKLHGEPRSFIIRANAMSNVEAWHWANCDVGVVPIPKSGKPPFKRFSKSLAVKFEITAVLWRESAQLRWTEV